MPNISDVFAEISAIQQWQDRRRRAENTARSFTSEQVNEMLLAHRIYPDIRAGSLLALARGGYRADHPLVAQIAELSARINLRDHPNGQPYGAPAVTPGMNRARAAFAAERDRYVAQQQRQKVDPFADEADRYVRQQRLQKPVADMSDEEVAMAAPARGVLTEDGVLRMPASPRWDSEADEYVFDDDSDRQGSELFYRVAAALAEMQGNDDPIPFIRPDGSEGIYYPKTGRIGTTRGGEADVDLPGPIDDLFERSKANIDEWLSTRRIPTYTLPGTEGVSGDVQAAGFPSTPKEAIRGAFDVLAMPSQEIMQGQVRNAYAATHGMDFDWFSPQSDLFVRWQDPTLDPGSGYFTDPESELAAERRRREAERGQIGGHNVSLGRWVADGLTPFDPDTKPYMILSGLIDAGVQVADPSAYALGAAGKARTTRALFEAAEGAGGIRALRWTVRPQNVRAWLDGDDGIRSVQALTDMRSPTEVWRAMNHRINMDLAVRLADTTTPAETRAVLEPELGVSIRHVATATVDKGRSAADPRRVMPIRGRIDAHDRDMVAFEMESALHNVGASLDESAALVDKAARAETPIQLNRAIRDAHRAADGILARGGIDDAELRAQLVKLHRDTHESIHTTVRAAMSNQGTSSVPVMVNGVATDALPPVLISELAPRFLAFADARDIRRVKSQYSNLLTKGSLFSTTTAEPRMATSTLEFLQNELWKPFQLIRAAWTIRVIGEEQLRMAAAGYDSFFNHPFSYMVGRIGTKRGLEFAESEGLIGYVNGFRKALSPSHGNWIDKAVIPTGIKTTFSVNDLDLRGDYVEAWGSELLRLHGDPVANYVAKAGTLDDAVEWFTRGGGNKFRADLAEAYPGKFDTLEQARGYIEGISERIHYMTGGDADLIAAVRTGKLGDKPLLGGTALNKGIIDDLRPRVDMLGPQDVPGHEKVRLGGAAGTRVFQAWDRAVDGLFGMLMTNRTNNLSRSQVYRQAWIKETTRLLPAMTEDAKTEAIRVVRGLSADEKWGVLAPSRRAVQRMESAKPRGALTFEEADLLAGGVALDEVKTLLYDLSRRGRFMDAARLVFPFGEAWSEVITRWLGPDGLIARNPKVVRRFQQAVQGARGEDFGEVMGAPEDLEGNQLGFFWHNEFGEEVFVYPGSALLTEGLLGVEVPLTGRVEGLSMFGTVIPGLGPAVQIPAGWVLQNKPGPQFVKDALTQLELFEAPESIPVVGGTTVKEQLLPFGSIGAQDQGDIGDIRNFVPTWMRTAVDFITGGDGNEQAYGNAVMSVAGYLVSTGQYGTTPAERQRLMEDASFKARWFYLIKAIAQGVSPSAPAEDWRVVDQNGRSLRLRALAEEYRDLQVDDYETADQTFLDRYGEDILAAVQPKSAGVEYSLPTTAEGVAWLTANPEVDNLLPHVYGFFAPKGGEFDYTLHAAQYESGDRHQLTLREWTALMNATKGDMIYADALAQVGEDANTDGGRAYLREVREFIAENYDGWGDKAGIPSRPDTDTLIRELQRALEVDAVMDTDAGQGLAIYLENRNDVLEWAQEQGYAGIGDAQALEGARQYLNDLAAWVIEEHPGFKDIFDIVLSRETQVEEVDGGVQKAA